jgi:hypothetical protein
MLAGTVSQLNKGKTMGECGDYIFVLFLEVAEK